MDQLSLQHISWWLCKHSIMTAVNVLTVYVLDNQWGQAMSGQRHQHLSSTLPPRNIVWWAPTGDGTEQQCQVVLPGQLLGWRAVTTQSYQHLTTHNTMCTVQYQYVTKLTFFWLSDFFISHLGSAKGTGNSHGAVQCPDNFTNCFTGVWIIPDYMDLALVAIVAKTRG